MKQRVTFLFPVFVGVLLSNNQQDENDQDQEQTDPDTVEPAGRSQVKVTRRWHTRTQSVSKLNSSLHSTTELITHRQN